MERNVRNAVENLIDNGFQVINANDQNALIQAVGNDGENVIVRLSSAGYCSITIDGMTIANLVQPYNVGAAARLRRHVGMFENVTSETLR